MNRPSLYAAFGDKQALYLKTLQGYLDARRELVKGVLREGRPLAEAMRELFGAMIEGFLEGDHGARGCFLVGTAATEAVSNPEVRKILAKSLTELEGALRQAFAKAKASGELGAEADPAAFAVLATALSHSLALRARAGQSRAALRQAVDSTLKLFFSGPARSA
jgi:AcrR family transcriptional regulator